MNWINKLESLDQKLIILLNGNNNVFLDELMWFVSKPILVFLFIFYLFIYFSKLQF